MLACSGSKCRRSLFTRGSYNRAWIGFTDYWFVLDMHWLRVSGLPSDWTISLSSEMLFLDDAVWSSISKFLSEFSDAPRDAWDARSMSTISRQIFHFWMLHWSEYHVGIEGIWGGNNPGDQKICNRLVLTVRCLYYWFHFLQNLENKS